MDGIGILRVGEDMAIVPKPQPQVVVIAEPLPGCPLSSERNSAPSSASTRAQTWPDLAGDTATPMRPLRPLGRPGLFVSSVQVSPPSVD
jgi:hypothetical protein